MRSGILIAGVLVSGCSAGFASKGRIDTAGLRSTDAVPFAEIIQNIRCDVSDFLRENDAVKTFSIGGVITAKTTRVVGSGYSAEAAIPVAPSLSIALGGKASNEQTFGLQDSQAVVVYREEPASSGASTVPWIDCSNPGNKLVGPLLNLQGRREQMERIPTGNPRLRLPGFRIQGSIYLVKEAGSTAGIKVYVFSGGAETKNNSSYRIDFDLATKWKPLIADYEVEASKPAAAPAPNVVYVIQATKPPVTPKRGGRAAPDAPTPPSIPNTEVITYSVVPDDRVTLGSRIILLAPQVAPTPVDPSAPKPDVPK